MRLVGLAILMASMAGTAWADAAYIRLEAWREPAEAAAKARDWATRLPQVVTWQAGGWVAIGIGPLSGDSRARLATLKAERAIPRDAYLVTLADGVAISTTGAEADGPAPDAQPDADAVASVPGGPGADEAMVAAADSAADALAAQPDPAADPQPEAVATPPAPDPETHIRIEAFQDRDEAEAALSRWRQVLPGAALWQLPGGWHAITTGPVDPARAGDWLAAWKAADAIPADAFAATEADLGALLEAGAPLDPDIRPPPPPVMPPVAVVQEALHWAGHYEGEIDGRTGPQTNAAIAAEMQAQGISPGTRNGEALAMQALLARRDAWRDEMGLAALTDAVTGLTLTAPVERLEFLREDRGLSIYGPRNASGAALILFNQPGGRAEMEDLAGLITALGWVGHPERQMSARGFTLAGGNDTHIGHAEGRLVDGRVTGFVLIWPAADAVNAPRLAAVASETLEPAPAAKTTGEETAD